MPTPRLPALVIPKLSADDWQLYCSMKGVGTAARGMNSALGKSLRYLRKELRSIPPSKQNINKAVLSAYKLFMEPAMHKYRGLGADDTEPRQEAQQQLSDAARTILGMDKSELSFYDLW